MNQTIIEAKDKFLNFKLSELWEYRQLLFSLAWRDIKVRYIQSYLGFLWIIVNPVLSLLILYFIFGVVVKTDTDGAHSLVFISCGLLGWNYFASLTSDAGLSILNAQEMVKKIYFPKIILPLSKAITGLFELTGTFIVLIVCALVFETKISEHILWMPFFLLVAIIAGLGLGIWVSALTIRYRDIKFVTPFFIRIGFYITPIAYSADMVPEKYQMLYFLNPIAGVVEGLRWSIIDVGEFNYYIWYSLLIVLLLFISGLLFFAKIERTIADII